ncbi:RNA-binding protein 42 [Kappamyces sp. JEL0829]|nr:RNA-binding protein 42 [Kappamyces sp. JEL0829]
MSQRLDELVQDFNPAALEKIEKLKQEIQQKSIASAVSAVEQQSHGGLVIKGASGATKATTKKVPVRIRPSDSLGAAPMPEGYGTALQALRAAKDAETASISKAPLSFHERQRIAQESKPYEAPKKKSDKKILRVGGGKIWEDTTLADWDQDDYRLFAGDLGNEVNEDILTKAFAKYPSLLKTHVVRDKRTGKTKGYGFISFHDPDDYVKAMREMNGKYVGSRPISLRKSNVKDHMATKESIKRQKELAALVGNKV